MEIILDDKPVALWPGMTVRHALLQRGLAAAVERGEKKVYDAWGNELGLDGALSEGDRLFVR